MKQYLSRTETSQPQQDTTRASVFRVGLRSICFGQRRLAQIRLSVFFLYVVTTQGGWGIRGVFYTMILLEEVSRRERKRSIVCCFFSVFFRSLFVNRDVGCQIQNIMEDSISKIHVHGYKVAFKDQYCRQDGVKRIVN